MYKKWSTLKKLIWLRMTAFGNAIKTVTGAIVTFVTSKAAPLINLTASLSPIQDLHGYPNPWPAGGGVNVANINIDPFVSAGVTVSAEHSIVTINGTKNGGAYKDIPFDIEVGTYYAKIFVISGTASSRPDFYILKDGADIGGSLFNERQFTVESGSQLIFRCALWVDNSTYTNYKIGFVVSKTSGITAFSPYSNICPISGHTGVTVYRTGINVWDEEWEQGSINQNSGENQSSTTRFRSKNYIPIKPSTSYYFHTSNDGLALRYYDRNKTFLPSANTSAQDAVITTPSDAYFLRFVDLNTATYGNNISINYPSTDHDYHAYTGNTYPITFPDGQTVYSGTLSVNEDGTGVLTVDRVTVSINGSNSWIQHADGKYYVDNVVPNFKAGVAATTYCKSNIYQLEGEGRTSSGQVTVDKRFYITDQYSRVWVYDSAYSSVSDFESALNSTPLQVLYPLATPVTIPLTAEQVGQITTLKGTNVIWVDDSDEITVQYLA